MSITGSSINAGLRRGVSDALMSIRSADDAKANVDNVSIFTGMIKKAEESAQASL